MFLLGSYISGMGRSFPRLHYTIVTHTFAKKLSAGSVNPQGYGHGIMDSGHMSSDSVHRRRLLVGISSRTFPTTEQHLSFFGAWSFKLISVVSSASSLNGTIPSSFNVSSSLDCLLLSFFAHRVWILSKNTYLTMIIVILASIHFGLGIVFTVGSFQRTSALQLDDLIWVTVAGLGSGAAADLLIAGSLCYYLSKTRTGFRRTDSLISSLILWSITTGLLTSILDLVVIVTFSTLTDTWIWEAIFFVAGKCYVNSLLASLSGFSPKSRTDFFRGKAAHRQGSEFVQFTPGPSEALGNYRSGSEPSHVVIAIQRDTVYQADYENTSTAEYAVSTPISKVPQVLERGAVHTV
ncbi:hypothetical protein D9758_014271 [Tetrapyrgos nigripes]|uniref:DUF6534 domain-containing protein n=1 Tax=Tetrapyrgos nigripes TaxID=182062 RepID=A0A8H5C428_9AGAR|nr:hypothetical protein D9758_014271 [Tetrapyrgos nigripes]